MYVIKVNGIQDSLEKTLAYELFNYQYRHRCFVNGELLPKKDWEQIVFETSDDHFIYTHHPLMSNNARCAIPATVDETVFEAHWKRAVDLVSKINEEPVRYRAYEQSDSLCLTYMYKMVIDVQWNFIDFNEYSVKLHGLVVFDLNDVLNFERSQYVTELELKHFRKFAQFTNIMIYWSAKPDIKYLVNTCSFICSRYSSSIEQKITMCETRLQTIRGDPNVDDSCIICRGKCYERGYVLHGIQGIKTSMFTNIARINQAEKMSFRSVMLCLACLSIYDKKLLTFCQSIISVPTKHTFNDYLGTVDPLKRALIECLMRTNPDLSQIEFINWDKQRYTFVSDGKFLFDNKNSKAKYVYLEEI
jgi:hypothetical protein